ncbi:hypothetical protein [Chryseobacterium taeanense]|uniref:hypothetical protein n=1 Tax=Chryseobacterium taeanense TaxID=311334 RepID=UPI0035AEC318
MKKKYFILIVSIIIFFVIAYFIPIPTNTMCGESPLCWYKFGVYCYEYDAESGGNTHLGGNIHIYSKVGGFTEYLGLKDIDCNR